MKRNSALKTGGKMDPEPMVGIFWLLKNELVFDVTPVSLAEPYGDCVGHAKSHIAFWADLQRAGVISLDTEYEEPPRGRVVHNVRTGQYIVYADQCIRTKPTVVRRIIRDFSLPADSTVLISGEHYRASITLFSSPGSLLRS
jgi:hypothetical protein